MKNIKHLLGVIFLGIGFFINPVQATDNIYKIDTNGVEDSPASLSGVYDQGRSNSTPETRANYLNMKPSGTVWMLAGKRVLGAGQGLIPFASNGVSNTFYSVFVASLGIKDSTGYSGGFGGGYRKIFSNSYMLGGYALADFNRSPLGHNFWVGNIGVELLNYNWDFRVNGYFPTGKRYWLANQTRGIYEETGTGFDFEVGRLLPIPRTQGLKLFAGGFRYSMNNTVSNITGIEIRAVYPITGYATLELRDSYDVTRNNVFMGGLRFILGGYNDRRKEDLGVAGRISDPIERNFANFASCNTSVVNKK
ncbi:MAG: inverse autotransporter beta domain-containing protein [bacterium]